VEPETPKGDGVIFRCLKRVAILSRLFLFNPKKFKSLSAKRIPSGEGREGKKARRSTDYFRL
jgi:hypothetical protein